MEQALNGKTALITGASRGIGADIAIKLAALGAEVAINYNSSSKAAHTVYDTITHAGGKAALFQADVTQLSELESLFKEVKEQFGKIDLLINNAGTLITKPIKEVTEQEYDELFAINVKSVFFSCQLAAQYLSEGGRIINISTTVTQIMLPGYGLYAASKGAVNQITRVLSKELGEKGITVNSISPGPTDTELFRDGKTDEQIAGMASMSAFNRIGTPTDIADAVSLLVRDEARWITGQNLFVNGGLAG